MFRPPADVRDVDRLIDIRVRTYPDYVDPRDQAHSFSGVAAWYAPEQPYAIDAHDVLGRTPRGAGDAYTIIGVAPQGFTGITLQDIDIFLPASPLLFF